MRKQREGNFKERVQEHLTRLKEISLWVERSPLNTVNEKDPYSTAS